MAGRKQGFLLGCLLLVLIGGGFFLVFSSLWFHAWTPASLSLASGGGVGLVTIEGPITGSTEITAELDAVRRDPAVRAVVLRVDSPGGEVGPSQEIHDAVARLSRVKPVVASFGGVAASGGYYVALEADSIVAEPGTLTGSIGVIFSYPTLVGLFRKTGVKMQVYKSGPFKDMGSYAREPTEEEEQVFDDLVGDVYDQFVTAVSRGRHLDRDAVLRLADGRAFTGRQAREVGLVDRLGDLHLAVAMAARMGGLPPEPRIIRKGRPRLPVLDLVRRLVRDGAHAGWGPRLEYRLR